MNTKPKQKTRVEIPNSYYALRGEAIGELGLPKADFKLSEDTHEEGFTTISMGEIFEAQFLTGENSQLVNVFEISDPLLLREELSHDILEQRYPIISHDDFGYGTILNKINNGGRNGKSSREEKSDGSDPELLGIECLRLRKLELYLHKSTKYITPFLKTVKNATLKKVGDQELLFSVTNVGHREFGPGFFDEAQLTDVNFLPGVLFQMLHALGVAHSQGMLDYCDLPNGSIELQIQTNKIGLTLKSDKLACIGKRPQQYALIFSDSQLTSEGLGRLDMGNCICKLGVGPYARLSRELLITEHSEQTHHTKETTESHHDSSDSEVFYSDQEDEQYEDEFFEANSTKSTHHILDQLYKLSPTFTRDKSRSRGWHSRPESFFSTTFRDCGVSPVFTDVWDAAALFVSMCCSKLGAEHFNKVYQFKKGQEFTRTPDVRDLMLLYMRVDYSRVYSFDPVERLFKRFKQLLDSKLKLFGAVRRGYVRDRLKTHGIEELFGLILWMKGLGYTYIPDDSERWEYGENPFHIILNDKLIVDYINALGVIPVFSSPAVTTSQASHSEDLSEWDASPHGTDANFTELFSKEKLESYLATEQMEESAQPASTLKNKRWKPVNRTIVKIPLYEPIHEAIKTTSGTGCFDVLLSMFNWVPDLRTVPQNSWGKPNYDGISSRLPVARSVRDLFSTDYFSYILNSDSYEKNRLLQRLSEESGGIVHAYFERALGILNLDGSDIIGRLQRLLLESVINS